MFVEIYIWACELYRHDLTANGRINLTDIFLYSSQWLSSGPLMFMDLTGDEVVT